MEKGQILIIVTLSAIGIIAIVGLALDVGLMFIENARLRRAVDAAALAAALQYREGYTPDELVKAAEEFLVLNGINDPSVQIDTCVTDPTLCPGLPRKLVRVRASVIAHLAFLPVIGINEAPMTAEATSETASVDVVLVIDVSESMTWTAPADDPLRDPYQCNQGTSGDGYQGNCRPFDDVKRAAVGFVEQLYFPYDRVAVVTFDKYGHEVLQLSSDPDEIISTIKALTVYEGDGVCPSGSPCRQYQDNDPVNGIYQGFGCQSWVESGGWGLGDPTECMTTNIGGGLGMAGNEFVVGTSRLTALWVTIILTDGTPNAGACPPSRWIDQPWCRDPNANARHSIGSDDYDAQDYARDMADFVAHDQHSLIFSIGLGSQAALPAGTKLLQYAADQGLGLYYPAPSSDELREIFQKIGNNIATRLAK